MEAISHQLSPFITPAILVTVVAFLIRFFGKAIADQRPFSDDRGWEIELSGLNFFIHFILVPGALAFGIIHYIGSFGGHWTNLAIVSVAGGLLMLSTIFLSQNKYQFKSVVELKLQGEKLLGFQKFKDWVTRTNFYIPLFVFSIIFCYVLIAEYKLSSLPWLVFIGASVFTSFLGLALNFSLRTGGLPIVDIYLIKRGKPIKDVMLLKVNDDNVRFRDGDRVIILNKDQILKIKFAIKDSIVKVSKPDDTSLTLAPREK